MLVCHRLREASCKVSYMLVIVEQVHDASAGTRILVCSDAHCENFDDVLTDLRIPHISRLQEH